MLWKQTSKPRPAAWPFSLPKSLTPEQIEVVRLRVDELAAQAQYGWGQTIDFGPFVKEGVVKDRFLDIIGIWDEWKWWPARPKGLRVADVGCLTGGMSLVMAHRGAEEVVAIDEIPEHIAQCDYLRQLFGVADLRTLTASLYQLPQKVEPASFDIIVLSGVLYHLSDMLVGLLVVRQLLKVGGLLLIESTAVDDDKHSYANFGRFALGIWWQPSSLCIRDMCEFMGLSEVEVKMYLPDRCVARARKLSDEPIPFRRGLSYPFEDLRDARPRTMDVGTMAPR
jgi:2-polyprenyl-3-methyl-5-hydroxy-6-metoxy-1,4-benzoquinol methylase